MRDYIIISDSTTDLPASYCEEHNLPLICLSYILEGNTYKDGEGMTMSEFYNKVREGAMPTTSQINPEQGKAALRPYCEKGMDILYIAFSPGLAAAATAYV
ncbi:MAG: DegV family protein [Lachnospiraceae bacterium]|nr:DegV family protein [Candidatus Equihabitans merdae]